MKPKSEANISNVVASLKILGFISDIKNYDTGAIFLRRPRTSIEPYASVYIERPRHKITMYVSGQLGAAKALQYNELSTYQILERIVKHLEQ